MSDTYCPNCECDRYMVISQSVIPIVGLVNILFCLNCGTVFIPKCTLVFIKKQKGSKK